MSYPFEWRYLDENLQFPRKYVDPRSTQLERPAKVKDGWLVLPQEAIKDNMVERIYNLDVYSDDIWIISNPKCGSTWMQEILIQLGKFLFKEVP